MRPLQPKKVLVIGFFLVLIGFLLPFLMVLGYIKSTLLLNFIAYVSSTLGLILGMIGAAMIYTIHRR